MTGERNGAVECAVHSSRLDTLSLLRYIGIFEKAGVRLKSKDERSVLRRALMNFLLKPFLISRASKPLVRTLSTSWILSSCKLNPNPLIYRRRLQRSYSDTTVSDTVLQRRKFLTTENDKAKMAPVLEPYFKQYVCSLRGTVSGFN